MAHVGRPNSRAFAAVIGLVLCVGCQRAPAHSVPGPIVRLSIPAAVNANPTIAARGARVMVAWSATTEEVPAVFVAMSSDAGQTFGAPIQVNDVAGDARPGGEQAPRAVLGPGDLAAVVWTSKLNGQTRVRLARSRNGGRSFEPAVTLNAEGAPGIRGWSAATADVDGNLHISWLDNRESAGAMPAGAVHNQAAGHTMSHDMRQDLYYASVRADGQRSESRVATGTCFCCKTSVSTRAGDATYVAFRHVYPTNLRDMAVARSTDGGLTFGPPVRVSEDGWQIEGCPEDGPSTAIDAAGSLHIVWPTMILGTGQKGVFYSSSTDHGGTFAPRQRLDDGSGVAAHPQLSASGKLVAAVWDVSSSSDRKIFLRLWNASAAKTLNPAQDVVLLAQGEAVAYPSVAMADGRAVVAWMDSTVGSSAILLRSVSVDR